MLRIPLLLRFAFVALLMLSLPLMVGAAEEAPAMPGMPPPVEFPGALDAMLGRWEGTGTSTMGDFTAKTTTRRAGNYIVTLAEIHAGGMLVETLVQVFSVMPDGRIECHNFDGMGEAEFVGTVDDTTGSLRWEDGGSWRQFNWTVNTDGTLFSTYDAHMEGAPAPFDNFHVEELDHRVGDA
jgi:hypothetical protein